jgi:hypothetical protein
LDPAQVVGQYKQQRDQYEELSDLDFGLPCPTIGMQGQTEPVAIRLLFWETPTQA